MDCILMNKNHKIAGLVVEGFVLGWEPGITFAVSKVNCMDLHRLPYVRHSKNDSPEERMGAWLNTRCGANHNYRTDTVMKSIGLLNLQAFLKATHASSLNDTFWIRERNEEISWEEVSLYRKEYSSVIADACLGLGEIPVAGETEEDFTNCPEFVTNGSFRRGFQKDGKDILFFKRSSAHGYEAICEGLASEVMARFLPNKTVPYTFLVRKEEEQMIPLSCCRFFTDEKTGMVTYYHLAKKNSLSVSDILSFMKEQGCDKDFAAMVLGDCLICNTDRHFNNFGFLVDNDSLQIKGLAPAFDMNLSLFPNMMSYDRDAFPRYVKGFEPRFGGDFTRLGSKFLRLYPDFRPVLEEMEEFHFTLSPELESFLDHASEDGFNREQIIFLEDVLHRQAKAILSGNDLTLSMAMEKEKTPEDIRREEIRQAESKARTFIRLLELKCKDTEYAAYAENLSMETGEDSVKVFIDDPKITGQVIIDFLAGSVSCRGKQFPEGLMDLIYEKTDIWFTDVKERLKKKEKRENRTE